LFAAGASSDPVATRIVRAAHGDSSGVRGAARLWPASWRTRPRATWKRIR